jgi:hypothetical protein
MEFVLRCLHVGTWLLREDFRNDIADGALFFFLLMSKWYLPQNVYLEMHQVWYVEYMRLVHPLDVSAVDSLVCVESKRRLWMFQVLLANRKVFATLLLKSFCRRVQLWQMSECLVGVLIFVKLLDCAVFPFQSWTVLSNKQGTTTVVLERVWDHRQSSTRIIYLEMNLIFFPHALKVRSHSNIEVSQNN